MKILNKVICLVVVAMSLISCLSVSVSVYHETDVLYFEYEGKGYVVQPGTTATIDFEQGKMEVMDKNDNQL